MQQEVHQTDEAYSTSAGVDESVKWRFRKIINWASEMMDLTVKEDVVKRRVVPRRGEVWTAKLGENVGSEASKTRPCLIIQNDVGNANSPTVIVVPISHRECRQPTHVSLSDCDFLYHESNISGTGMAEQIKVISKARLGRKIADVTSTSMSRIDTAVKISLGLS